MRIIILLQAEQAASKTTLLLFVLILFPASLNIFISTELIYIFCVFIWFLIFVSFLINGLIFSSPSLNHFPHLIALYRIPWFIQLLGRWKVPSGAWPNSCYQTPRQNLLGEEADEEMVCDSEPDIPRTARSWDPLLWLACVLQARGCWSGNLLHSWAFWHQGLGWIDGDGLFSHTASPRNCLPGFQPLLRHGWGPSQTPGSPDPGGLCKQAMLSLQCGESDATDPVGEEVPGRRNRMSFQEQERDSFCLFYISSCKTAHSRAPRLEGIDCLEY